MARPGLLLYVGQMVELAPLVTGFVRRARMTAARTWVFGWVALLALMNAIGWAMGRMHVNNHIISHLFTPFQGAAILWAFSLWQTRPVAILTTRIAIPVFVAAWAVSLAVAENLNNFSRTAEPVYSMLALGAALYTLASRSGEATEPLPRQDWFWICGGLSLYFAALTVLLPLSAALVYSRPDIVIRAYHVTAVVNIAAFLCIANGFLCPTTPIRSGAFFSPASSV